MKNWFISSYKIERIVCNIYIYLNTIFTGTVLKILIVYISKMLLSIFVNNNIIGSGLCLIKFQWWDHKRYNELCCGMQWNFVAYYCCMGVYTSNNRSQQGHAKFVLQSEGV